MPPRLPTDSEYMLLPAWAEPLSLVRERIARCEAGLDTEAKFGKGNGEKIDGLAVRLRDLEDKRARSEGRDEVQDGTARRWGKLGAAMGGGAALPQLLEWLGPLFGG